jgi:hypothetical protein
VLWPHCGRAQPGPDQVTTLSWLAWERDTAAGYIDCGTYGRWTWEGRPGGRGVTGPLENRNAVVDLRFVGTSGGVRVFVDQAAQDGFSEDPFAVEVGHGDAGSVEFVIGDALGDALVRRAVL